MRFCQSDLTYIPIIASTIYNNPIGASQVSFIGTLLYRVALLWFASTLEKDFPLLEDLDNFLTEFNVTFGEIDKVQIATTKIHLLRQGSRPASIYATDFRQLACDVD